MHLCMERSHPLKAAQGVLREVGPRSVCLCSKGSVLIRPTWETEIKGKQITLRRTARDQNELTQYFNATLITKHTVKMSGLKKKTTFKCLYIETCKKDQLLIYLHNK